MSNLIPRLKKRYDMTARNWKSDCHFSKKLAWLRIADDIGGRAHLHTLSNWAHAKKEKWILNYLTDLLQPVILKYRDVDNTGIQEKNAPIWICWWTGEETAPPLVRQCIKSIRKNAGNHSVHMITQNNYGDYITIPEFILKKMQNGQMGLAHFADYLRVSLLEEYGGLWLDATMFCSREVPEECFSIPFFTCKSRIMKGYYLSDFQWVTFCLGGWKQNIFYQYMKEAFECYWKVADVAIDYLFFDHLIYLGKQHIPAVKKYLEAVPINNIHRDDLQAAMNEALPAEEFWNVVQKDTALYKLSWRETYMPKTPDGKLSVYGYLLEMEF